VALNWTQQKNLILFFHAKGVSHVPLKIKELEKEKVF